MAGTGAGLEGLVVGDSSICHIDGERGELYYRGYSIGDLAESASFEEVSHLLWLGELPDRAQLAECHVALLRGWALPPGIVDQLRGLPRQTRPMDALRSLVSLLGGIAPVVRSQDADGVLRQAVALTGAVAAGVAGFHRIRSQLPLLEPRADLGHAGNFLWLLLGEVPSRELSRGFDAALVLHMEHGYNASTFAARVAASTQADLHGAVTAAIATLKGPLHGGANERVMAMFEEIGDSRQAAAWVDGRLLRREKVMGFGHRIYRTMDPRARILRAMAERMCRQRGLEDLFDMACIVEERVVSALGDRGIAPNVDFFSASVYHAMGIPRDIFTPVFAVARVVGWTAHVLEQYQANRLIRPESNYTGPAPRRFVPLADRG